MSNYISQNVIWSPPGRETAQVVLSTSIKSVNLDETRVAFCVPDGEDSIIVRAYRGRLFRQINLPAVAVSCKPNMDQVREEIFGNLDQWITANGMHWAPCGEPGYAIVSTDAGVRVQTVVPEAGTYPDLFSAREPKVVEAEALEMALNAEHSENVPSIISAPEIIVAEGAPGSRATQQEKQEARALRLEAALQIADELKGASSDELSMMRDMSL